jgi:YYY domain-containing protein
VIDTFRWLAVTELLSLAFLPLTMKMLASLTDRGYAFSRVLGLLCITWMIWWIGTFIPIANNPALLWLLVAAGFAPWLVLWRETFRVISEIRRVIAVEELVFLTAFVVWAIVRSLHPDITGTEKPMDLMLLQATGKTASFPPQDLWLSGFGVNYYYFGYLMMAVLGRLAGTPAIVTYNLALALVFAAAVAGTYSIAYNLSRRLSWAALGPVFAILLGNAHSFFLQILHGQFPWNQSGWYWESSRVVGETSPGVATTINEFPMFSFILGDLHPHLLDVPIALLAIGTALTIALDHRPRWNAYLTNHPLRLIGTGGILGALFVVNSWDFPTYVALVTASLLVASQRQYATRRERAAPLVVGPPLTHGSGRTRGTGDAPSGAVAEGDPPTRKSDWIIPAAASSCLVAAAAVVLYAPYYLTYRSPTGGIGRVYTPTAPGQFLQVFGAAGVVCVALLLVLAWEQGMLPNLAATARRSSSEAGHIRVGRVDLVLVVLLVVVTGLGALAHLWVLLLSLGVAMIAILVVTSRSHPSRRDTFALALLSLAALIIAGTETVYLRDSFGGSLYRMNTVFKFYFQAWLLLGLAAAYGAFRVYQTLRTRGRTLKAIWITLLVWVVVVGGSYTVLGTISYYSSDSGGPVAFQEQGLNGMSFLATADPQDYAAIRWLQAHIAGAPVILEATGGDYSMFGRVSTFVGLPTLLGWGGHEAQWRGNLPTIQLRQKTINRIYSTGSATTADRLLRAHNVSLVYVGPCEQLVYGRETGLPNACGSATKVSAAANALTKFEQCMHVIYRRDGVSIYGRG